VASPPRIVFTEDSLRPKVRGLSDKINTGVRAIMEFQAPQCQNYMRENAPWDDQTGNARNGLFAKAYSSGGGGRGRDSAGRFTSGSTASHGIVLYGSVPYQIWLEVRFSGRYAIIVPTVERKAPDVMRMVNKLLARL